MKMLFGMGIQFGLRGNTEHCDLNIKNITYGIFPKGHPFSGHEYYGLDGLLDKTHKIDVHTDYVRDTKNTMRVPKMNDDPTSDDLGGCIERYIGKMARGQFRLYTKSLPQEKQIPDPSTGKIPYYYPLQVLGRNKVRELFKEGAAILGLPDPEKFAPHSLRACFVSRLANGKGVSDQEMLDATRHNSISASANYQERDTTSESNKFEALGIKRPALLTQPVNSIVEYDSPTENPEYKITSTSHENFSLTQQAINVVEEEIKEVRYSLKPKVAKSSNHKEVLRLGERTG